MNFESNNKRIYLTIGISIIFILIIIQLLHIQIFDNSYKVSAQNNALRYETQYPVRGLILDRNDKILVGNKNTYDIIVTPYDAKNFDTTALCNTFSLDREKVREKFSYYRRYRTHIGYQQKTFLKQVNEKQYSLFIEQQEKFPGFSGIPRTTRKYPYNAGGNLLGYIAEVNPKFLKKHSEYTSGDYHGITGIEEICEKKLKGEKGYNIYLRDSKNKIQSHYKNGVFDQATIPGTNIHSTIDAELQNYGELLMQNKVGSIVAIDPSTGEVLSMVSSPGINVSILAEINKHYNQLIKDPLKPMFNRAVMSPQPPGSVFKIVNGLIAQQEGVLTPDMKYSCHDGYHTKGLTIGCHHHRSPLNMREAIMMSCNAYFCNVYRSILENPKYNEDFDKSFDVWANYVRSFGFGNNLNTDIPHEQKGFVPSSIYYDKIYGQGHWNAVSNLSLAIGQGELGCTPLHLANLCAIIANKGYYYIPHIIQYDETSDNQNINRFDKKHYCMVDSVYFDSIIDGMERAVNSNYGEGATAVIAKVKGLNICGKTGTAENPHGDEHSVFICFAPRKNPKIAIAVYIENAGFGSTWAAPIASLMTEKYLTREISPNRKWLENKILNANLLYKVLLGKKAINKKH
ncbi:MAG: penicillin-binding transpeptidase domain-containing protein [Bacteroidales bacterium]